MYCVHTGRTGVSREADAAASVIAAAPAEADAGINIAGQFRVSSKHYREVFYPNNKSQRYTTLNTLAQRAVQLGQATPHAYKVGMIALAALVVKLGGDATDVERMATAADGDADAVLDPPTKAELRSEKDLVLIRQVS